MTESKYCVLCDIGMATQTSGEMTICNQSRSNFKDSNGRTLRLDTDDLHSGWNSPTRQEIKTALLNNIEHENCKDCWAEESCGRESARIRLNRQFAGTQARLDQPVVFMLKPGNVCNLSCRHCNPHVSSKWYRDHWQATAKDSVSFVEYAKRYDSIRNSFDYDNQNIWPIFKEWSSNIVYYELYGAEPLLIDPLLDTLRRSVATGAAQNQSIHLNTNGTIWHDDFNYIFGQFKQVRLGLSLDGIHNHYDYMRYPSKWEDAVKNIKRYKQLADRYPSINLSVCITLSLLNVYYLVEYLNFFWSIRIETDINLVHRPDYLNMRIADDRVKKIIVDQLSNRYLDNPGWRPKVQSVIDFIQQPHDDQAKLLEQFWNYTTQYDQIRNQQYATTFPEFYKVLINE